MSLTYLTSSKFYPQSLILKLAVQGQYFFRKTCMFMSASNYLSQLKLRTKFYFNSDFS